MYILIILTIAHVGGIVIPSTAEFETKKGCELAAAWLNQRPNINAVCVEDKQHDNAY